ncbi:Ribonucleotide reductase of class II (coenzyme B12-dependent) [Enhygromyxa salina]|uniref:Ribonucleotide reductase of class II (Coenzyme B12-dependent) n=1 Tax=Enhygromyxa salina TaxID=215803 RepID=A0A0C1ZWE4_9BACT|nr:hypothetical protein [Enhygromyxa salina]KIG15378.1 Ribonucleotide reductase of class II (coenzyme B12-dependent) [Enhygromyxa salina]
MPGTTRWRERRSLGLLAPVLAGVLAGCFAINPLFEAGDDGTSVAGSGDGKGTGSGDGMATGSGDGMATGSGDGMATGSGDGMATGSGDGMATGSGDGMATGSGDGMATGSGDGMATGSGDGMATGSGDGMATGSGDGMATGSGDGMEADSGDGTETETGEDGPAGPPIDSFVDDFEDGEIGPEWSAPACSAGCTIEESGGAMRFGLSGDQACACTLTTGDVYSLIDTRVVLDVPAITNFHPPIRFFMSVSNADGDAIEYGFDGANVFFAEILEGNATIFSSTTMYVPGPRYWQLREQGGQLYFESSPDAAAWDLEFQTDTPFYVGAVRFRFGARVADAMPSNIGISVPNYNVLP